MVQRTSPLSKCKKDIKEAHYVLAKAIKIAGEVPTEGIYKLEVIVNSEDFR